MFAEWVTQGVAIGVKIFFAGFTLALIGAVFIGLAAVTAKIKDDDDEKHYTD